MLLIWALGVEKGDFHITYDFIGNVFRSSTRGSSPGNNFFMDAIYGIIGYVRGSLFACTPLLLTLLYSLLFPCGVVLSTGQCVDMLRSTESTSTERASSKTIWPRNSFVDVTRVLTI